MTEDQKPATESVAKHAMPIWQPVVAVSGAAFFIAVMFQPVEIDFYLGGPSPVSRARADMRSVATALESYYVDNNTYPAWAVGSRGVHASMSEVPRLYGAPTFAIAPETPAAEQMFTLTTPIAYITGYPRDPFAGVRGATFAYYSDPLFVGWVIYSPGPDGDYDIDPVKDYNVYVTQPSITLILKAFDPTNGAESGGDIFRVKQ